MTRQALVRDRKCRGSMCSRMGAGALIATALLFAAAPARAVEEITPHAPETQEEFDPGFARWSPETES